ncbi:MAG: fimbrillin family protein [Bacteroidetes bacterium]|nr:fimbrillin family protein [Bacteroidota bacterium]
MKKLFNFAILLTVVTFVGCTNENYLIDNSEKNKIDFDASLNSSTKAENLNSENFKSFKVFSYLTTDNYIGTSQLGDAYMNNVGVSKNANSMWECEKTFYWPIDGSEMQFFAISSTVDIVTSANSYPFFNYTVKNEAEQEDLLASILLNKENLTAEEDIVLSFNHILSKINFSIKGEKGGYTYDVTKIEIKDVYSKGVFTFDNSEKVGAWSGQSELTNYAIDLTDFSVNGSVVTPVIGENGSLILMPQNNPEGAKIVVTYSVKKEGGIEYVFNGFNEIKLPALDWNLCSNINYILNLPIVNEEISIDVNISDWNKEKQDLYTLMLKENVFVENSKNVQLEVKMIPEDLTANYEWESSNPAVATVTNTGLVTGLKEGVSEITVKYKNQKKSCNVFVDVVNIPSVEFRNFLLNDESVNIDRNEYISKSEALNCERIVVVDQTQIESFEGIENFVNLKYLDCSKNNVEEIDLRENIKLTYLNCSYLVNIQNLNIISNTLLTDIDFSCVNLSYIDLDKNIELLNIRCIDSPNIKKLYVNKNLKLENLFCTGCESLETIGIDGSQKNSLHIEKPAGIMISIIAPPAS